MNWVRKRTGFAATTISTKAEAEAFLNKNVAVVISYFEKFEVEKNSNLLSHGSMFCASNRVVNSKVFRPEYMDVFNP